MKTNWMILSLVLGLLLFMLGCIAASDPIQFFGAIFLLVGIVGLFEKIWPEEN
jgi:uncharacterized membrane protein HdeD (DUF308 family)